MNGIQILDNLNLPEKTLQAIKEVGSKIKLPSVVIKGIIELTCNKSNGVEILQKILLDAKNDKKNTVNITYLGAPKYRISVTTSDFKSAEKILKPKLEEIQKSIEKQKGTFKFTREESKKTREG